jgi:hypothetical protein
MTSLALGTWVTPAAVLIPSLTAAGGCLLPAALETSWLDLLEAHSCCSCSCCALDFLTELLLCWSHSLCALLACDRTTACMLLQATHDGSSTNARSQPRQPHMPRPIRESMSAIASAMPRSLTAT